MTDKPKVIDSIPEEFASYEEAAEFWDTHDTTDYLDSFETVAVQAIPSPKRYLKMLNKIENETDF